MILGGLVMISIGLFIIIGTFKLFKPTDYSTWKDAESIVEKVRTETWDDGELRPCLPRIIVSFELDGELIKGKSNCIGTEKTIKQVIAKYPKGSKVCFKYDDSPKETIVTQIADNLNFQKTIYIHIDDKEFPNGSVEKKAKLFGYGSVSYTHLDVYKRQGMYYCNCRCRSPEVYDGFNRKPDRRNDSRYGSKYGNCERTEWN